MAREYTPPKNEKAIRETLRQLYRVEYAVALQLHPVNLRARLDRLNLSVEEHAARVDAWHTEVVACHWPNDPDGSRRKSAEKGLLLATVKYQERAAMRDAALHAAIDLELIADPDSE